MNLPWRLCVLAVCLFVAGCGSRPRAPALANTPVYENPKAGFRFLAPKNWNQHASAQLPPGPLKKPRLLVQYKRVSKDKGAFFEVGVIDLEEGHDIKDTLTAPASGASKWTMTAKPEPIKVGPVPATRYVMQGTVSKENMVREAVVFQKGQRAFFFVGLFYPGDETAKEQTRRTVESVIWND